MQQPRSEASNRSRGVYEGVWRRPPPAYGARIHININGLGNEASSLPTTLPTREKALGMKEAAGHRIGATTGPVQAGRKRVIDRFRDERLDAARDAVNLPSGADCRRFSPCDNSAVVA